MQIEPISAEVKNDRASSKKLPTEREIENWIVNYVAELLEVNPNRINITTPFDRYNLDSLATVGLAEALADWLEIELEPTLLYNYTTIEALNSYLAEELEIAAA